MQKVVQVMFPVTKVFAYFDSSELDLVVNDLVIVETESGLDSGIIKKASYMEKEENLPDSVKKVVRKVSDDDRKILSENDEKAKKALEVARKYSNDLDLNMGFVDCYYTFDKSQLVFSFVADNRVDFRELAKKLAQKYKTRIELRQIGVRDKAKKVGGLGPCGLFLCCHTFLTDFNSVSINMAKNQFLALNPSKINGICGRLLCCLGYENDLYTELKKGYLKIGSIVETEFGIGKVSSIDVFKGSFQVDLKEKGIVEMKKEEYHGSVE